MHCPLGAGRKGLGGGCRELEKAVHHLSVTSIYTSSYNMRNTDPHIDGILKRFAYPHVSVCVHMTLHAYSTCMY